GDRRGPRGRADDPWAGRPPGHGPARIAPGRGGTAGAGPDRDDSPGLRRPRCGLGRAARGSGPSVAPRRALGPGWDGPDPRDPRDGPRARVARVFPGRSGGLLLGLALGDTSRLDPGIEEDFRATGLSHLTAVSGENVAMFLAPILGLATMLGLGRRWRLAVGLFAVGFFVLLTRAEPSV